MKIVNILIKFKKKDSKIVPMRDQKVNQQIKIKNFNISIGLRSIKLSDLQANGKCNIN